MKKIRFIVIHKKTARCFISAILLSFSIIVVNAIYFTTSNLNIRASSDSNETNFAFTPDSGGPAKLAIIIDDFGQNRRGVKEMMSINRHITFAVMPFLTFTEEDARNAHEKGYEVIVHLPMEANGGHLSWVGPRPILSEMNDSEVKQLVEDAFRNVPFAKGANIHMGSKVGSDERIITDVLSAIKALNLYFVDSRSCKTPIAKKIADSIGVICYDRNVFLDSVKDKSNIKKNLKSACEIALKKGRAVAIGHVGTEGGRVTAEAISEMLPEIEEMGVQLVFVSELSN